MSMPIDAKAILAPHGPTRRGPTTRALRVRQAMIQGLIIVAAAAVVLAFATAVRSGLARHGVTFSYGYLGAGAGFEISEGRTLAFDGWWPSLPAFASSDTNLQALAAGLFNTVKVAAVGIVLSTILGTLLGVSRLSTNWILRQGAFALVEFLRNTPLLIQLVFWYYAVVLRFPPAAKAAKIFGGLVASQQGLSIPTFVTDEAASPFAGWFLGACGAAWIGALLLRDRRKRLGLAIGGAAALAACLWIGFPLTVELPAASRFSISGGTTLSPEMSALLLAIVFNSGSYIAEIVRGTVESMPKGQWEAAAALGMGRRLAMTDIILPQVFRVVLPSFGNQYISLTKNTALGIAIGFPDLFNVNGTVSNQTGRNLEGIIVVMVVYLLLSWIVSGGVNVLNGRLNRRSMR